MTAQTDTSSVIQKVPAQDSGTVVITRSVTGDSLSIKVDTADNGELALWKSGKSK